MAMAETKAPMVALLSSPGMGHLIPVGELAKRLAHGHGFSVTIFSASFGPPSRAHQTYINSLPDTITSVVLPPVQLHDVPAYAKPETRLYLTMTRSVPFLRQTFKTLTASSRVVALVVDLFSCDAFDAAREFGIRPYLFFTTNTLCLSIGLHLLEIVGSIQGEFRDLEEPVRLPGCVPVHGKDLPDALQERENEAYRLTLHHIRRYMEADGIFVNSFSAMEPGAIEALMKDARFPPLYPIGPLIRTGLPTTAEDGSECLKWLDEQPPFSVVFVSFGSLGTLSPEQMTELAMGLELSEQRFLWVVRSLDEKDPFDLLPDGFLRRTEGTGMVVPSWAPQAQVLAHPATGGFVSHCGWNSTLESVVHGVPMVAWPLFGEQRMNAAMLSGAMRVALWPRSMSKERGVVLGREEVGRVVRELMVGEEGKEVRRRMQQLKDGGAAALRPGGSAHSAMSDAVNSWVRSAGETHC